jgi:hypothetical protein
VEPLRLPRGSVRAVLVLLLTVATIAMVFLPVADKDFATGLFGLAGFVLRDYFAVRKEQNDEDGPPLADPVDG